jgi:competence ComEA-like helix-hairpin-helix protein
LLSCDWQKEAKQVLLTENQVIVSETAISINIATAEELKKILHIGDGLAQKIVEHREKFRRFRKAEHLMLVDGISDNKFREVRSLIRVE